MVGLWAQGSGVRNTQQERLSSQLPHPSGRRRFCSCSNRPSVLFPDPREAAALRQSMQFPAAPGEGPRPPPPADVLLEGRRWQPGQASPWAWGCSERRPRQRVPGGAVLVAVLEGAGTAGRGEPGVRGGCRVAFPSWVRGGEQARCLKPAEGEQGLLLPCSTWRAAGAVRWWLGTEPELGLLLLRAGEPSGWKWCRS